MDGAEIALDHEALALRVEDGRLAVLAREGLHGIEGVPEGEHGELGALVEITYNTGIAYRWDIRPSTWARHACAVAGRQLNRAEWANALPERDYAPAR